MLNLFQRFKTAFRKIGGFFVVEIMGFKIFLHGFHRFSQIKFLNN